MNDVDAECWKWKRLVLVLVVLLLLMGWSVGGRRAADAALDFGGKISTYVGSSM